MKMLNIEMHCRLKFVFIAYHKSQSENIQILRNKEHAVNSFWVIFHMQLYSTQIINIDIH